MEGGLLTTYKDLVVMVTRSIINDRILANGSNYEKDGIEMTTTAMINKMKKDEVLKTLREMGVNEQELEGVKLPDLKDILKREVEALNLEASKDAEEITSETLKEESNEEEESQMTTVKLVRANKLTISKVSETELLAKFYRTHTKIKEVTFNPAEVDLGMDTTDMNFNVLRELYRKYFQDHAQDYGIFWDPANHQVDAMPRKWESTDMLEEYAPQQIAKTVNGWVEKISADVEIPLEVTIETDDVRLLTVSNKGVTVEPTYKNGNIAWADIDIIVDVRNQNDEREFASLTLTSKVISGQLSKPKHIGEDPENHFNYTNFREALSADYPELAPKVKSAVEVEVEIPDGEENAEQEQA